MEPVAVNIVPKCNVSVDVNSSASALVINEVFLHEIIKTPITIAVTIKRYFSFIGSNVVRNKFFSIIEKEEKKILLPAVLILLIVPCVALLYIRNVNRHCGERSKTLKV